jgi:SAM-dependent methyltransferase
MKTSNVVPSQLSDDEWLEAMIRGDDPRLTIQLPQLPPAHVQRQATGGVLGADSLRAGFTVYRTFKSITEGLGCPLSTTSRILDFGCGWGRVLRFFLKDLPPENIFGVDVDSTAVASCNEYMPDVSVQEIPTCPPIDFPSETFDLVYSYSVFSHLPAALHLEWVQELTRCLKPGGVFLATTQGRSFIAFCRELQTRGVFEQNWEKEVAAGFPDPDKTLRDYDAGKYVFFAPFSRPLYGHTLIPKSYVESEWTRFLTVHDFIDDPAFLPQALIVAQKTDPARLKASVP